MIVTKIHLPPVKLWSEESRLFCPEPLQCMANASVIVVSSVNTLLKL